MDFLHYTLWTPHQIFFLDLPHVPPPLKCYELKVALLTALAPPTNINATSCAGSLSSVISTPAPTATSVTITWTQPEFSLPVVGYIVTVTRLNGLAEIVRCASYTESRLPVTTTSTVMSVQFTDLQEFSSYRATVTALFGAIFEATPASSNLEFTTLSAGMKLYTHPCRQAILKFVSY